MGTTSRRVALSGAHTFLGRRLKSAPALAAAPARDRAPDDTRLAQWQPVSSG